MDRRAFLKALGGVAAATAAAVVAPEATKAFFFAPKGGWTQTPDGLYIRAAQQTAWVLQVTNRDVMLSENLDRGADELFTPEVMEMFNDLPYYSYPITGGDYIAIKRGQSVQRFRL